LLTYGYLWPPFSSELGSAGAGGGGCGEDGLSLASASEIGGGLASPVTSVGWRVTKKMKANNRSAAAATVRIAGPLNGAPPEELSDEIGFNG
jgi:hypothetical protein